MISTSGLILLLLNTLAQAQDTLVRIPEEWTYLLPHPFNSVLEYSWLNSTTTGNATIDQRLKAASQSRFVSYSDEFTQMVGPHISSANISTIPCPKDLPLCAYEAGVWIPATNEVWFSYINWGYPHPGLSTFLTSFDLNKRVASPIKTSPATTYPLGGYFFENQTYWTDYNLPTDPASIIQIDPVTKKLTPLANSYFGMPIAPADDLVVTRVNGKVYIYLTTFSIHDSLGPPFPVQEFATAVWRWDVADKILTPVISNTDIIAPNGIRVSPDGRTLYVTNTWHTAQKDWILQARNTTQSNNIYAYDLNDHGFPINRRLFALDRTGFSNGLHVDNKGRIWTCDNDGINVRSPDGKVLGLFNFQPFYPVDDPVIANFALAGNKLVIGNHGNVVIYELAETLVTPGNLISN